MDALFRAFHEAVAGLYACAGVSAYACTRLYTHDGAYTLVADDASLVTLLRFDGSIALMGDEQFCALVEQLGTLLAVPLQKRYHALQIVFDYDPSAKTAKLAPYFEPLFASAHTLHLALENVLADWQEKLASFCAEESCYLAFWTRPSLLSRVERKKEKARLARERIRALGIYQGRSVILDGLRALHSSQVAKLVSFCREQRIKASVLPVHEAVRVIRGLLLGQESVRFWRPDLLGDKRWFGAPEKGQSPYDASHLLPRTIAAQIWPSGVRLRGSKAIEVGGRVYAPFVLRLPPQTILPFNRLFQAMKGDIPWRASFLLTGDGLGKSGLKNTLARILSFAASANIMQTSAYEALRDAELHGKTIVGFQAVFATWVATDTQDCLRKLASQSARFQSQIEAWGSAETEDYTGDPLLALTATLPCLMPQSLAPKALAPLEEALALLPLSRVSSPFSQMDLPMRTPDGKFMPVGLFHSLQASWNEIVFAGMGAGKSFFLNTLNFFFLLRTGQSRLPWLTVVDIGPSSSGVITLIRNALPKEERYLAVFAKLKNQASHAVNPFDTLLGCPYPLRNHEEFLCNLLSLLCTPLERTAPCDGMSELLREATHTLYARLAPEGMCPKKFDAHLDPDLTQEYEAIGGHYDAETTWWDLVERFFAAGKIEEAHAAQSRAMPLISDLAAIVTEHNVAENYASIAAGPGGESVPLAASRYLISALTEYPVLSHPTAFRLGGARILGLDLSEVTPRGGVQAERQSGIMYMLARFLGAAHFFLSTDDLVDIPKAYRAYHKPRLESLMADPKRLCYDEFHRASCQDMQNPLSRQIISDLTTATRESRKLNLSIGLYSQRLSDFPPELVAMATSIYALGAGNAQEACDIAERFGYTQAAREALRTITRPTKAGAECIALYRTALGESIQFLTNSAGSYARWAFSTTAEDMHVRNRLYALFGAKKALDLLVRAYPEGTVKEELERRKGQGFDGFERGKERDLLEGIVNDLLARAKNEGSV